MIKLKMKVTQEKQQKMTLTQDDALELKVETLGDGNGYDYNKLINKPTLDGETIQNDMKEKDPTVPEWVKKAELLSAAELAKICI